MRVYPRWATKKFVCMCVCVHTSWYTLTGTADGRNLWSIVTIIHKRNYSYNAADILKWQQWIACQMKVNMVVSQRMASRRHRTDFGQWVETLNRWRYYSFLFIQFIHSSVRQLHNDHIDKISTAKRQLKKKQKTPAVWFVLIFLLSTSAEAMPRRT